MFDRYKTWLQNNYDWKIHFVLVHIVTFVVMKSYILADLVFIQTIPSVWNFLSGESITNVFIRELFDNGLKAFELLLLRQVLVMKIYGTIVMFICSMLFFYGINRVLLCLGFTLNKKCNVIKQAQLIFCWIGVYSLCNVVIYSLGFSDEVYQLLTSATQSLLLFCMISFRVFSYHTSPAVINFNKK